MRGVVVRLLAMLVVLAGIVALAVVYERVFRESDRSWDVAVQATAATVVAAASVVYASLTYGLLRATRDVPQQAAYRASARAVARSLQEHGYIVYHLAKKFPLDLSGTPPAELFVKDQVAAVRTLADQLEGEYLSVPRELANYVQHACERCLAMQSALMALNNSVMLADTEAAKASSTPTWSRVRAFYYSDVRERPLVEEWEELVAGRIPKEAEAACTKVMGQVVEFMLS
jgi:hypothetical protein